MKRLCLLGLCLVVPMSGPVEAAEFDDTASSAWNAGSTWMLSGKDAGLTPAPAPTTTSSRTTP